MQSKVLRLAAACAFAAFSSTGWAGTVEVAYINPESYSDAGASATDERANVEALGLHLRRLGERLLPPGHVLRIEVLDVDLAGVVRPTHRGTVRTLRGMADFPAVHLRHTLQAPGQPARSGEDRISDMNYTRNAATHRVSSEHLYYEKRMLDAWFRQRFALAQ